MLPRYVVKIGLSTSATFSNVLFLKNTVRTQHCKAGVKSATLQTS